MKKLFCFCMALFLFCFSTYASDFIKRENLKQFDGIIIKNKSVYDIYDKIKAKNKPQKDLYAIQKKALEPYASALVSKMKTSIQEIYDNDFRMSCNFGDKQSCRLIVSTDKYYFYGDSIVYVCLCGHPWSAHKFHFKEDRQANKTDDVRFEANYSMYKFLSDLNKTKTLSKEEIIEILKKYGVEV